MNTFLQRLQDGSINCMVANTQYSQDDIRDAIYKGYVVTDGIKYFLSETGTSLYLDIEHSRLKLLRRIYQLTTPDQIEALPSVLALADLLQTINDIAKEGLE